MPVQFDCFAAVLGQPIKHSFSPLMHQDFFSKSQIPFFAIEVEETEWTEAISFLKDLGLSFAAVTSPLKKSAALWIHSQGVVSQHEAINTLLFDENQWHVENTDRLALINLLRPYQSSAVAVWGGGGVLNVLREILPHAVFYSARSGQPRAMQAPLEKYDLLIWAAPRKAGLRWPEPQLVFHQILDLNYKEDSVAREVAVQRQIPYQSGREFFRSQALEQQKIWSKRIKK